MTQRPRILVVEDEPSIADTIVYAMEQEGFAPQVCGTGAAALALARQEAFALVLLDIGLPDGTGLDVCRQLRTIRDVPVIFLTARQSEMDRVVGLEIGGDDYVCKPFSPRELTARVRAVLRRTASVSGGPPRTNADQPLAVDEARCQIRYFGEALALSRYEYRLLQTLVNHPGRVFTRAQLMEHASDEPEAAMERTVDAHVKSIRAKMKAVREDAEPIITHRGIGYSLAESWT